MNLSAHFLTIPFYFGLQGLAVGVVLLLFAPWFPLYTFALYDWGCVGMLLLIGLTSFFA